MLINIITRQIIVVFILYIKLESYFAVYEVLLIDGQQGVTHISSSQRIDSYGRPVSLLRSGLVYHLCA